jgi:hypothetical protein
VNERQTKRCALGTSVRWLRLNPGRFGGLYPIYVRGMACLAGQHAAAVGEFQRIRGHRSIVLVDPMDAMAP